MTGGDRFRALLKERGMTQAEAAVFLRVAVRTVHGWANSTDGAPRAVELLLLLMGRYDLSSFDVFKVARDAQ